MCMSLIGCSENGPFDLVAVDGLTSNLDASSARRGGGGFRGPFPCFTVVIFDKRGTGISDRDSGRAIFFRGAIDAYARDGRLRAPEVVILGRADGGAIGVLSILTYLQRTTKSRLWSFRCLGLHGRLNFRGGRRVTSTTLRTDRIVRICGSRDQAVEMAERVGAPRGRKDTQRARRDGSARCWPGTARAPAHEHEHRCREVLPSVSVPTLLLAQALRRREGSAVRGENRIPEHESCSEEKPGRRFDFEAVEASVSLTRNTCAELPSLPGPPRPFSSLILSDLRRRQWNWSALAGGAANTSTTSGFRRTLARYAGREIDTAGDGFFASGFDGPARAIRCACAIRSEVTELGLGFRIGVHTGESGTSSTGSCQAWRW